MSKKKLEYKIRFSLWSAYALANLKLYKGRLSYLQVLVNLLTTARSLTFRQRDFNQSREERRELFSNAAKVFRFVEVYNN